MKSAPIPTGPDNLPLDPMSRMREPFFVRLARARGVGPEEPINLPNEGQNYSSVQLRNLESWARQHIGGGDFTAKATDMMGQLHSWSFHLDGADLRTQAPPAPPPTNASARPGNGSAGGPQQRQTFAWATTPSGHQVLVPEEMTSTVASFPPEMARQVWGSYGSAEGGQKLLELHQQLERERSARERTELESRHREEISELRASLARIEQVRQSSPGELGLMAKVEELQKQVTQERELGEMRRSFAEQIQSLKEAIKEQGPREDPMLKVIIESQRESSRAQAEAAKAQAEAAKETARYQAEAAKETAREQRELWAEMLKRSDQSSVMPTVMQAFASLGQVQQASMSMMMDAYKEVVELKRDGEKKWYETFLEPIAANAPEIMNNVSATFAASAKARAVEAANARDSGQRRPRQIQATATPAGPASGEKPPADVVAASGTPTPPPPPLGPADPRIEVAIMGYEGLNEADERDHDQQLWASCLTDVVAIRNAIAAGKAPMRAVANAIVQMIAHKDTIGLAPSIPAFKLVSRDEEHLATFLGLVLGPLSAQARTDKDVRAQTLQERRQLLVAVRQVLEELARRTVAEQQGATAPETTDDDSDDGDDQSDEPEAEPGQ